MSSAAPLSLTAPHEGSPPVVLPMSRRGDTRAPSRSRSPSYRHRHRSSSRRRRRRRRHRSSSRRQAGSASRSASGSPSRRHRQRSPQRSRSRRHSRHRKGRSPRQSRSRSRDRESRRRDRRRRSHSSSSASGRRSHGHDGQHESGAHDVATATPLPDHSAADLWAPHRSSLVARGVLPEASAKDGLIPSPLRPQLERPQFASTLTLLNRKRFAREFDVSSLRLNSQEMQLFVANPHLQQVFVNRRPFVRVGRCLTSRDRSLQADSRMLPYARRQGEVKSVEHWGQRKLLLSEIEFLTTYARPGQTVLYAGAAPGNHILYLAEQLFPELKFILVDPAPFACRNTEQVHIRNEYFTSDLCRRLLSEFRGSGEQLLFISDIRSMSASMSNAEKEARVLIDMQQQDEWLRILAPRASMLKFRLPYEDRAGHSSHFEGVTYLPVWGGCTTSETRHVVLRDAVLHNRRRSWSHAQYEDMLFYFNTVTRTSYFEWARSEEESANEATSARASQPAGRSGTHADMVAQVHGLDHCFDCCSELLVLDNYLRSRRPPSEVAQTAPAAAEAAAPAAAAANSASLAPGAAAVSTGISTPTHATRSSSADMRSTRMPTMSELTAMSADISRHISSTGRQLHI